MNIKISLHYICASINDAGQRIDNFLIKYLKKVPKGKIYNIIRNGEVRINSCRVIPRYKIKYKDLIRIPPMWTTNFNSFDKLNEVNVLDFKLKNRIIYEDNYFLVLNKPCGVSVHGGSGRKYGIIEILRMIFCNVNFLELVHRLDVDTSGVLLIAKKKSVLKELHKQLRLNMVKKEYIGLVRGKWPAKITKIKKPLTKICLKNGNSIVKVDKNGKLSETHFKIQERFHLCTLLKIYPITGRNHQIRVHTKYVSHPIVYDKLYGDSLFNNKLRFFGLNRMFLHASSITFYHPIAQKNLKITSCLDKNLEMCLSNLRKSNFSDL